MDTWHYTCRIFSIEDLAHPNDINDLGALGWELITLIEIKTTEKAQQRWMAVFKKLDQPKI